MNTDDGPQERGLRYMSEVTEPASAGPSATVAPPQAPLGSPDGARAVDTHPRSEHLWPQSSKSKGKAAATGDTRSSDLAAYRGASFGHTDPSRPALYIYADRDDSPRGRSTGPRNGRAYVSLSPHQPEAIIKSRPIAAVPRQSLRRMQDSRIADSVVPARRRSSTPRVPKEVATFQDAAHANLPEQGYVPYPTPAPNSYFTPAPIIIIPPAPNEPPYISVNPFSLEYAYGAHGSRLPHTPSELPDDSLPPPVTCSAGSHQCLALGRILTTLSTFLLIDLPRQLILALLLLRLPILYFHRVSRVFDDADLSEPDIHRLASANAEQWRDGTPGKLRTSWIPDGAALAPHLQNFRHEWEGFVDLLVREWTVLSVVSGLILLAILTLLQIEAAAKDPIARTTGLLSIICALVSLAFGCLYAVRFGTMRKISKAVRWAEEAQNGRVWLVWNVWVMVSMPAVWFCWSIILFATCIVSFAWRTGVESETSLASSVLSHNAALGLRVGVSALLGVGLVYFLLALYTFREYGDEVERRRGEKELGLGWTARDQQVEPAPQVQPQWSANHQLGPGGRPGSTDNHQPHNPLTGRSRTPPVPRSPPRQGPPVPMPMLDVRPPVSVFNRAAAFDRPPMTLPPTHAHAQANNLSPFPAVKVGNLRYYFTDPAPLPAIAGERDIRAADWQSFIYDLENVWILTDSPPPSTPGLESGPGDPVWVRERERVSGVIYLWNARFFGPREMEIVLCLEKPKPGEGNPGLAVYLTHRERVPHTVDSDLESFHADVDELKESGLSGMTVIRLLEDASHGRYTVQHEVDFGAQFDGELPQSLGPGSGPGSVTLAKSTPILAPSPVRAGHSALLASIRSKSDT